MYVLILDLFLFLLFSSMSRSFIRAHIGPINRKVIDSHVLLFCQIFLFRIDLCRQQQQHFNKAIYFFLLVVNHNRIDFNGWWDSIRCMTRTLSFDGRKRWRKNGERSKKKNQTHTPSVVYRIGLTCIGGQHYLLWAHLRYNIIFEIQLNYTVVMDLVELHNPNILKTFAKKTWTSERFETIEKI